MQQITQEFKNLSSRLTPVDISDNDRAGDATKAEIDNSKEEINASSSQINTALDISLDKELLDLKQKVMDDTPSKEEEKRTIDRDDDSDLSADSSDDPRKRSKGAKPNLGILKKGMSIEIMKKKIFAHT